MLAEQNKHRSPRGNQRLGAKACSSRAKLALQSDDQAAPGGQKNPERELEISGTHSNVPLNSPRTIGRLFCRVLKFRLVAKCELNDADDDEEHRYQKVSTQHRQSDFSTGGHLGPGELREREHSPPGSLGAIDGYRDY